MARNKLNRVGERFKNREDLGGYEFIIVEYNGTSKVLVEFQDEYKAIVPTQYHKCLDGGVKNPYHPYIYGVGFIGQGKYKSRVDGKLTKQYDEWKSFLQRSNDEEYKIFICIIIAFLIVLVIETFFIQPVRTEKISM